MLKVDPRAARLQLELDRLSWSVWCSGRRAGRGGGGAHSRWSGYILQDRNITVCLLFISEQNKLNLCLINMQMSHSGLLFVEGD